MFTSARVFTRRAQILRRAGLATLVAMAVAGCGSGGGVRTETPVAAASTPSPTSSPASPDEAILTAYRAFFAAQTPISEAPAGERRTMLEPVATDPALSRALRGMFAADESGEVGYGQEVLNPRLAEVEGDEARITDCQDTSATGRKERDGGKTITRGTPEADVETTMRRGTDGTWRVATVDYKDDKC